MVSDRTQPMVTSMIRILCIGCTAVLAALFLYACNDKLDVQQEYDFSLSSWHLQSTIRKGESVEIRLTLHRSGDFQDARYYIGYIQMAGKGEVYDSDGTLLVNRELHELDDIAGIDKSDPCEQVFTLFYKSLSTKSSQIQFVVVDSFNQERTLDIAFENNSEEEE